jgi:hypothetical protein
MRRSPAAAPATPPSIKTQSTGSCAPARGRGPVPAQDRCAAPHGRLRAAPGPRPRPRPPRRRSPIRHVPRQQQQAGGNEDILSSANGPSTFLQMTYTAENPHADGSVAPRARPRFRLPRHRDPHATSPAPTTTGWREDRCPVVSKRPITMSVRDL